MSQVAPGPRFFWDEPTFQTDDGQVGRFRPVTNDGFLRGFVHERGELPPLSLRHETAARKPQSAWLRFTARLARWFQ